MIIAPREHARGLYLAGWGVKRIARLLQKPRSTVQAWRRRDKWERVASPPTKVIASPPAFVWCTNIGHETAHLVDPHTHKVACGIDIGRFNRWTIEPEPLRKCLRCPANA